MTSTQASLLSLGNRVTEVEDATSSFDSHLSNLEQTYTKMCAENEVLCSKVIDLEACSRHQNIKIFGLAEKNENGRPTEFLFLPELLGASNFSKPIVVDQAHRLGRQPSDGNDRRRMMIHHYQLQLARQQSPLNYKGKVIHIFHNFPAEVMKQRQVFEEVRKRLKDASVRIGFIYPARLRVTLNASCGEKNTSSDSMAFAETLS